MQQTYHNHLVQLFRISQNSIKNFLSRLLYFHKNFFWKIYKKNNLDKIAIYHDFIFYQVKIFYIAKLASSIPIKIVIFTAFSKLAQIAVNTVLNELKQKFEIVIGILTIAIAILVADFTGNLLKKSIQLNVVKLCLIFKLVRPVLIKVYTFGINGIIWVFMFSP